MESFFVIFFLFLPRWLKRQRWPIAAMYLSPSFQCIKVSSLISFSVLSRKSFETVLKNLDHTLVIYVQCELNMSAKTIYIVINTGDFDTTTLNLYIFLIFKIFRLSWPYQFFTRIQIKCISTIHIIGKLILNCIII